MFCPANTSLTGLGYQLRGAGGDVFPDDVVPAAASATVFAFDNGAAVAAWSVESYALCAPVPAGAAAPTIATNATGLNPNPARTVNSGNCPAGQRTVGVGGQMTGALGNAILTRMAPDAAATHGPRRRHVRRLRRHLATGIVRHLLVAADNSTVCNGYRPGAPARAGAPGRATLHSRNRAQDHRRRRAAASGPSKIIR